MTTKTIHSSDAPAAIGPYSQAVAAGGFVFLSGQVAIDPAVGKMIDGDVKAQTTRVMENLRAVLAASGCTFSDVVKTTIYLTDLDDFATVNAAYGAHFPENKPARATVQVSRLPLGAKVEIDAVAKIPDGK